MTLAPWTTNALANRVASGVSPLWSSTRNARPNATLDCASGDGVAMWLE